MELAAAALLALTKQVGRLQESRPRSSPRTVQRKQQQALTMVVADNSGSRSFPSAEWGVVLLTLVLAGTAATVAMALEAEEAVVEPRVARVAMAEMVLWC